ncbi:MAG: DUF1614 domain-containing protein [Methanophagales archaeon ANME-1-THS]|nr:MAG: DUF1614 domain-containing protein [Methanophagales archaeon ANME-1-THS]
MVYEHLKKMRKIVNKPQVKPLVFFGLLLIPTVFLCCDGLFGTNSVFFIVLLVMLLTSMIEVPLFTLRTKKPEYSDTEALCIGEIYGVPLLEEMRADAERRYKTRITLNMGGFIIPLVFAFYLLLFAYPMEGSPLPLLEVTMSTLLITLISYMLAEVRSGVGILVPNYIGIFAIPLGFLLAPSGLPVANIVEVLIFVPAIFGILLGMLITLMTLPREEVGSAFFNIGGIGSFYSIYLISFLALVLRSIA